MNLPPLIGYLLSMNVVADSLGIDPGSVGPEG